MQATAAFVFEGRAGSLSAAGQEQEAASYRQQAQSLWRRLNAAHPQNDFIAKRCAGVKIEHETEVAKPMYRTVPIDLRSFPRNLAS